MIPQFAQMEVAQSRLLARPLRGPPSYLLAVTAVVAPTLLRFALDPVLPGGFPFVTYHPFVLMAAVLLEWRLALLVTFTAALAGNWFFLTPRNGLATDTGALLGTTFMVMASASAIFVTTGYRRALRLAAAPALGVRRGTPRAKAAAADRPLPRGIGLSMGALVSIGLWATIAFAVTRLF